MLQKIRFVTAGVVALAASLAFADSAPKSIEIKVEGANKYSVEAFTMGGIELVGYLGDQKEEKGVQAVVYTGKAGADREADLAKLAARAGLKAFVKEGGKLRPIDAAKPGE
jgi:hypothetical protein